MVESRFSLGRVAEEATWTSASRGSRTAMSPADMGMRGSRFCVGREMVGVRRKAAIGRQNVEKCIVVGEGQSRGILWYAEVDRSTPWMESLCGKNRDERVDRVEDKQKKKLRSLEKGNSEVEK